MFGRHRKDRLGPEAGPRGGRGPGPGRGEGGRGGRRAFDQGGLRLVLLHLLGGKASHGYELIKAVEDLTGGAYSPSPGVIYPTLTLLEELGHAQITEQEGGRKLYTITEAGKQALAEGKPQIDMFLARAEALKTGARPMPGVQRAMENFRNALHIRLRGALSAEQAEGLIQLLDETARKVEKI